MRILSAKEVEQWDAYTIQNQDVSSLELMERAGEALFKKVYGDYPGFSFHVFCGVGNNGGDGLVFARLLQKKGVPVDVYIFGELDKASEDFSENLKLAKNLTLNFNELPDLEGIESQKVILVDALFGIGLNRPLEDDYLAIVQYLNKYRKQLVSIDIPSGLLLGDENFEPSLKNTLSPVKTYTIQVPKLGFFSERNKRFVGLLRVLDINLDKTFLNEIKHQNPSHFLDQHFFAELIKDRQLNAEKADFGRAFIIGGEIGMVGALTMAGEAALRVGAGLCTLGTFKKSLAIAQTIMPICTAIEVPRVLSNWASMPIRPNCVAVGPGLSTKNKAVSVLDNLLNFYKEIPLIIDADALNIIAAKNWHKRIPKGSVISPHFREFDRLFGTTEAADRHKVQEKNAQELGITILLKGAYSRIVDPEGNIFYNSTGNPGMAKGGSGDVLTGMICGLIARGYTPAEAACLATYLHGLAGDITAAKKSQEAMLPVDVVEHIPNAIERIYNFKSSLLLTQEKKLKTPN